MNEYTDIIFWEKYWKDISILPTENTFFEELIFMLPKKGKLLEIGGFPGNFAAYFKKKMNYHVTILDFYIIEDIIKKVEEINNLSKNSINFIQCDFLKAQIKFEYDVVCSFGFIEHFEDTFNLIKKHIQILKEGGILLITIPNFLGLNGIVQKLFHYDNYKKHNTKVMNIKLLNSILDKMKLFSYKVDYFGNPGIWLEKEKVTSKLLKIFIYFFNILLRKLPFHKNKFLSPYIYIVATK